ncbi:MAG: hypothetical protein N3D82_05360 [Ignisphaera sp.]|nr:hypothetical protein [Ignisphaera sp.]MCX8168435.1 hypothetical protein [Ignisphaera sp.]MDW8086052.1 hypothetical protein [Ignisphaera sp.]
MDLGVVATIIWLALVDSFDPCIFAIYSTLLISASMISMHRIYRVGLAFITSSYTGYFLFGALLRYVSLSLPRYILAMVTIVYGTIMFLHTIITQRMVRNDSMCREDEIVCRIGRVLKLDAFVNKGTTFAFLVGFVAAFTLFPCTAGMYIVFSILTAEFSFIEWLSLTLIYVTIFILPLILILLSFVGITRLKAVHHTILSHQECIKLMGSVLLIAVSIYIITTSPPTVS